MATIHIDEHLRNIRGLALSGVFDSFTRYRDFMVDNNWKRRVAHSRQLFSKFSVELEGGSSPYLLTTQSAKLEHNDTSVHADNYMEVIMYLMPHRLSGVFNMCPLSTKGCRASCLFTAGRLGLSPAQTAAYVRTMFLHDHPREFFTLLLAEIESHRKRAVGQGRQLVVRLNGTSDADWLGVIPELADAFPDVQWNEYTKSFARASRRVPANQFNVFSWSERFHESQISGVETNVVVVFRKDLPATFGGRKVVDGDKHDLRFMDEHGVVVGVRAKGKARRDTTGFVVDMEEVK